MINTADSSAILDLIKNGYQPLYSEIDKKLDIDKIENISDTFKNIIKTIIEKYHLYQSISFDIYDFKKVDKLEIMVTLIGDITMIPYEEFSQKELVPDDVLKENENKEKYFLLINPFVEITSANMLINFGIVLSNLNIDNLIGFVIKESYLYVKQSDDKIGISTQYLEAEKAFMFHYYYHCMKELTMEAKIEMHGKILEEIPIENMPTC